MLFGVCNLRIVVCCVLLPLAVVCVLFVVVCRWMLLIATGAVMCPRALFVVCCSVLLID